MRIKAYISCKPNSPEPKMKDVVPNWIYHKLHPRLSVATALFLCALLLLLKRLWRRAWTQFEEQKVSESSFWCLPWWECGSSRTEGSSQADPPNPTLFPTFTFSPQQREPLPLPHPPLQSGLPGPSQCAAQSGRGLVGWWLGGWGTPLGWWLRHFSHSLAEETWTWAWTHPSDTALCSISAANMMEMLVQKVAACRIYSGASLCKVLLAELKKCPLELLCSARLMLWFCCYLDIISSLMGQHSHVQ